MLNKKLVIILILSAVLLNSHLSLSSKIFASLNKVDCNAPEYILANECQSQPIKSSDFRIKRFKYILCEMEEKCHESRTDIANTILWAYEIASKDYKKDVSLLNFAEGLNGFITYNINNDLNIRVDEYLNFINN